METLLWVVHVVVAITVVVFVLLQHGKGADMGAAFGGGSSGSLFGASGSANFMSRATAVLATVFFLTSLGLTYFSIQKSEAKLAPLVAPAAHTAQVPAAPQGSPDKTDAIPR